MKGIFLLLFVLLTLTCFSQTYYPMPDSNAVWTIESHPGTPGGSLTYSTEYMRGDTLIAGELFHKIYNDYYYIGAIRNDIAAKKVYYHGEDYLCGGPPATVVLYDFNLAVGQAFLKPYSCSDSLVVIEIDSIMDGAGNYRKRFRFDNGDDWIEGMGSVQKLLKPLFYTIEISYSVVCFQDNNVTMFGRPVHQNGAWTTICMQPVSINDSKLSEAGMIFIGNNRWLVNGIEKPAEVIVYDVLGKIVMREMVTNDNCVFTFNAPCSGVYIMALYDNGVMIKSEKAFVE